MDQFQDGISKNFQPFLLPKKYCTHQKLAYQKICMNSDTTFVKIQFGFQDIILSGSASASSEAASREMVEVMLDFYFFCIIFYNINLWNV